MPQFQMGIYNRHYDADGRLISDDTRNIARITYYPYQNLPKLVRFADGSSVVNSYSPSGTLMQRNFITRYVKTVTRVDRRTGDTTVVERATSLTERRLYRGAFERQGSKWLLHTGVGHYDLTEGKHYYYIKDNLGSTVAVVDQSGVAHQLTAYYPSGLPHDLTASEARTTDRLHIGNRWIDHKGMNTYDNTARMHYPVLPSFDTPDPLAEQYPHLSPYAHCAANPITLTDPTGMYFNSADSTQAAIYMERLNQRIIQINKSDAKDRHEQLSEVNKSLQDIEDMRNDQNRRYTFEEGLIEPEVASIEGKTVLIRIDIGKEGSYAHEIRHGGQIARNEWGFEKGTPNSRYGSSHEIDAYRAEYSAVGMMINDCWVELFQMPMEIRVKTIKEINVSYLKRLYQNKKFLYGGFSDDWYKK